MRIREAIWLDLNIVPDTGIPAHFGEKIFSWENSRSLINRFGDLWVVGTPFLSRNGRRQPFRVSHIKVAYPHGVKGCGNSPWPHIGPRCFLRALASHQASGEENIQKN